TTVRLQAASIAPATRTKTWSHTGAVNKNRKPARRGIRAGGTRGAAAGEGDGERCVFIAPVESNRATASTTSAAHSARHFESGSIASMRETVAGKSRYEAPWPPTKCYSALSASTSPKVPSSPNGATADTRFSMPTRAHRLRACGQPGAMIASNSYTGRPGKKRGRRRGLLGVPCCRSTTHSASSQKKEFSGHAGEFNQVKNAQSRAETMLDNAILKDINSRKW